MALATSTPSSGRFQRDGNANGARKRLQELVRSPEQMKCSRCNNEVSDGTFTNCGRCRLKFCITCTELSKRAFNVLIVSDEIVDYKWKCKSCKTVAPTLERIDANLQELNDRQEKRLNELETKMGQLEIKTKTTINKGMQEAKENIRGDLKIEVRKMVDERTKEMDDRRRRELNIVVFNLAEGASDVGAENKTSDEVAVQEIATQLNIPELDIETSYRLEKKSDNTISKPRPLKLVLKDRKQRIQLLENARKIRSTLTGNRKNIVIVKDLTIEQRNERRDKLKTKKQNQPNIQQGTTGTNQDREPATDLNLTHAIRDVFADETIAMDQTVIGGINSSQPNTSQQCEY